AGNRYVLRPKFREAVDFRYLNLAEDIYPSLTTGIWGFDVILCRNVLIYFDRLTIARVAQRLIDSLAEDGWLLLGASDPAPSEESECDVVLTPSGRAYRHPGQGSGGLDVGEGAVMRGSPDAGPPPEEVAEAERRWRAARPTEPEARPEGEVGTQGGGGAGRGPGEAPPAEGPPTGGAAQEPAR